MRNFDEERADRLTRERSFVIGGQTFTFRLGLHPDVFQECIAPWRSVTSITPDEEARVAISQTIKNFLATEEDQERWDALLRDLRAEVGDGVVASELAITAQDQFKVMMWMIEEQTGHPTNARSSSGNGRERSGTRSMEPSYSPPVVSAA